jgi:hypothetical protein
MDLIVNPQDSLIPDPNKILNQYNSINILHVDCMSLDAYLCGEVICVVAFSQFSVVALFCRKLEFTSSTLHSSAFKK